MFRKFSIFVVLGIIAGAIAYGYLYYGVVVIYTNNPKISVFHVVEKPYRDTEFFFSHINKGETEKEVKNLRMKGQDVPWHMLPDEVERLSVYEFVMDTR